MTASEGSARIFGVDGLDELIGALASDGMSVIGPRVEGLALVLGEIAASRDLPRGWVDEQRPGHYRLRREGDAFFGCTLSPQSWKKFLTPPREVIWRMRQGQAGPAIEAALVEDKPHAFIGVRACELAAIAIQDRVRLEGPFKDSRYGARREQTFIVAVNCARAVSTCFCTSMGSGPKASTGFDIALTEIEQDGQTQFLAQSGSERGRTMLAKVASRPAQPAEITAGGDATRRAEAQIERFLETAGLPELLKSQPEHPQWDDVAARCLSCGNCTMVCPTCFCTSVEDSSALDGSETARSQRWDSCFTTDFSYIHGGAVRQSTRSHYRQWLTHKLATWHDQFGTSGCVGCGRCMTWCPVGIDLTEEAAMIRSSTGHGGYGDGN